MTDPTDAPNDSRRKGARRRLCGELAERLASEEGARTARLLQEAGFLVPERRAREPVDPSGAKPGAPRPIGIWKPVRGSDGALVFERPEPHSLGDHSAARLRIPAAKAPGVKRLCFFGESAAAGYLFAPHLTPAGMLQGNLDALEPGGWEVVDLARTNESLEPLASTVEASHQLGPDVLAVFAGNNWSLLETPEISPYAPSVEARQRVGRALADGGLGGPAALARRQVGRKAERIFARIAAAAEKAGARVVLLVPEVNLADWQDRQPPPWLPGDGVDRWVRLHAQAEAALGAALGASHFVEAEATACEPMDRGASHFARAAAPADRGAADLGASHFASAEQRGASHFAEAEATAVEPGASHFVEAEAAAREMLALVPSPAAWRLLARALLGQGREAEAAEAARREIDSSPYASQAFLGAPRAGREAAEILREASQRHGFSLVDLPRLFAARTGSPLPGRRLFLDYCHLTLEGIEIAMGALAAEVVGEEGDLPDLLARLPRPEISPEAEATAYLGAAVHTAHRLVGLEESDSEVVPEILFHWCRRALETSPGVEAAMRDLLEARAAPVPAVLTAAQERNLASPYRLLLQHGWRWDHLDADLVRAVCQALEEAGEPAEVDFSDRLAAAFAPGLEGRELTRAPFLWSPLLRFYPEVMDFADLAGRATLRSPWPKTSFCVVADGRSAYALDITVRLPPPPGATARSGPVRVEQDGTEIGSFEVSEGWSRHSLKLPAPSRGLHRFTLCWPSVGNAGADPLAAVLRRLEQGLEAELHPVFGEVSSVRLSPNTPNPSPAKGEGR